MTETKTDKMGLKPLDIGLSLSVSVNVNTSTQSHTSHFLRSEYRKWFVWDCVEMFTLTETETDNNPFFIGLCLSM